ncbi:MAG: uncharacterized protein HW386_1557, partial [Gammaproteobacteria bacterium]|nr:uncharacterized protein [Gammaproteobacteria bacterium]
MEVPQGLSDYITTKLIPINRLSKESHKLLLDNIIIETHPVDSYLFQQGDKDDNVYYLLEGKINMMATDESSFSIDVNVEQAFYPIGQMQPRQYSAHIISETKTLRISKSLFDTLFESDKSTPPIPADSEDSECDWMTHLLESRIFANIPPQNIQKIFALFEEISVIKNEKVVNQGDDGDYFYIIKNGKFDVTRRLEKQKKVFRLAILQEGETFGEESLLGNMPRNASVIAKTDGTLMRITKESFLSLIRDPAIKCVDYEEAIQLIDNGSVWLDVRGQNEFAKNGLAGGVNVPLNTLRIQINNLDKEIRYIVYCDNGSRSAIAAYLLVSKGYLVSHLKGGISRYQQQLRRELIGVAEPANQLEYSTQPMLSGANLVDPARHKKALNGVEAMVQTILSHHSEKNELSIAISTVLSSVYRQLE